MNHQDTDYDGPVEIPHRTRGSPRLTLTVGSVRLWRGISMNRITFIGQLAPTFRRIIHIMEHCQTFSINIKLETICAREIDTSLVNKNLKNLEKWGQHLN